MTADTELVRLVPSAFFLTVACYCVARLLTSFYPQAIRRARQRIASDRSSDLTYALMSLGMAVIAAGLTDVVSRALGMLVFAFMAAWFFAHLLRHGPTSRLTGPTGGIAAGRGRDRGKGGYVLHHLAGCVAMIYMFATGHPSLSVVASTSTADPASYSAASAEAGIAIGHYSMAPGANVSWLLGLYFLIAATSLGFRVTDPAVRVTLRPTVTTGASACAPLPRSTSTKLLHSPTGACASEVVISAGMAFMLFSAA